MIENVSESKLRRICAAFGVSGAVTGAEPMTMGNINTAYRVDTRLEDGTVRSYVLQRVNTYVFRHPREIMDNIDLVTTHIMRKNGAAGIEYLHTADGKNYLLETDGSFWRLYIYIDAVTFDTCDDPRVLAGAGRAFGEFQAALSDFDARRLYETIPDFHNTPKRLEHFFRHTAEDPCGRAAEAAEEIEFVRSVRERVSVLTAMRERRALPVRVTHNDTKTNNVLFDRTTMAPLVVIDLDTVMPGLAMHDFGDAVRSAACTTAEDERELSRVALDLGKFRIFAGGFLSAAADSLSRAELDTMALGALTITVELGVRFLDDYLTGDKYFRISSPDHNLVRARCQLALARDMLQKYDRMETIVRELAGLEALRP